MMVYLSYTTTTTTTLLGGLRYYLFRKNYAGVFPRNIVQVYNHRRCPI